MFPLQNLARKELKLTYSVLSWDPSGILWFHNWFINIYYHQQDSKPSFNMQHMRQNWII